MKFPNLKLNLSVSSVSAFDKACASVKLKGPTAVYTFAAIPTDDLNLLDCPTVAL